MTKPKLIVPVVLSLIAVLVAVIYIGLKIKNTSLSASPQNSTTPINVQSLKSALTRQDITKTLENSGIVKSGFGTNDGGICFLTIDFSVNFQRFSSNTVQILQKGSSIYTQGKILSGKNRCIVMLSGKDGIDTFSINPAGTITKVDVDASYFGQANEEYFIVPTEKAFALLDSNSNKVSDIWNKEKLVFTIAPISSQEYFAVTNYDSEQNFGKLIYRNVGKQDIFLADVEHILGIFSNQNSVLYIEQTGEKMQGWLLDKSGNTLAQIADIDPSNVIAYKTGFLFKTKPSGPGAEDNQGSTIGYVEKDGSVRAIIGSEGGFDIDSITVLGDIVYASEGPAVWKVQTGV